MLRPIRAVALVVAVYAAFNLAVRPADADQPQNAAVSGDAASLNAAGFGNFGMFGPLNGELVTVGVVEAGGGLANSSAPGLLNTTPNSTLPNGNPDLPSTNVRLFQFAGNTLPAGGVNPAGGPAGNPYPAGLAVNNHSSEVTGVVVGQGRTAAADTGIATGSTVQEAGITGAYDSPNGMAVGVQQSINNGATIVNLSLGFNLTTPPPAIPNNGQFPPSQFVDWAAGRFNAVITVAGNEVRTEVDSPADAFNGITVAATGVRRPNGQLSYNQEASYNVSSNNAMNPNLNANRTADGRIGVSIVAPGGDPGPGANNVGTFLNPPNFVNQFTSTAGGQYDFEGTNNNNAVYSNDTLNGVTSAQAFLGISDTPPKLTAPFPPHNPGPLLGGGDTVTTGNVVLDAPPPPPPAPVANNGTLAGTSYAAPLVAGAGAVVSQYGLLATATNAKSSIGNFPFSKNATDPLDHRLLKAILLNGAAKYNTDGTQLLRASGTAWTRSTVLQGAKALPAPLAANAVGPVSNQAQSGLDPQLGAGQLNLVGSLSNYAAGEQGPGAPGAANVLPIGWDYENVAANAPANTLYTYNFAYSGSKSGAFQATLAWDNLVNINNPAPNNMFQPTGGASPVSTFTRPSLLSTDFDLYFFQVNPNGTLLELAWSNSNVDNVEHIYDQPTDVFGNPIGFPAGNYQLDVVAPNGVGGTAVPFGLAWETVPEPASLSLTLLALPMIYFAARRRRRR
jgi:hypothetical protein